METPPRRAVETGSGNPVTPLGEREPKANLDDVAPGDALVLVALVPAPSLRRVLSTEAAQLLRESLRRIVDEELPSEARVVPWLHGQLLAILPATDRSEAMELGRELRRRWHSAWSAPVAVATGVATVDDDTPPSLAVMLAGAEVGEAKDSAAHA